MNRKSAIRAILCGGLIVFAASAPAAEPTEKAYIALEGEGKVAVLDTRSRQLIRRIDLTETIAGKPVVFAPHNVQVAPNGKSVWVTANLHGHHDHAEADQGQDAPVLDEVVVIDPAADTVVQRIGIAAMAHLSHVVFTPDGCTAYVNAQNQNRVYRIDAENFQLRGFTGVSEQGPHGIRLAPDGTKAYLAMLQGRSLGIMDTTSGGMSYVPLGGAAVQAGVTPDGKIAMASVYDTKRLALYDVGGKILSFVDLPAEAKGPVQFYPTPDSRFAYLADQGFYFDQPVGEKVYKIDLGARQVVKTITAGRAPHGVVVSSDGAFAYVTNLLSDDVSVIDTGIDQEVARLPVGKEPNGISLWSAVSGGTP